MVQGRLVVRVRLARLGHLPNARMSGTCAAAGAMPLSPSGRREVKREPDAAERVERRSLPLPVGRSGNGWLNATSLLV